MSPNQARLLPRTPSQSAYRAGTILPSPFANGPPPKLAHSFFLPHASDGFRHEGKERPHDAVGVEEGGGGGFWTGEGMGRERARESFPLEDMLRVHTSLRTLHTPAY
jgi:hypothetical protein